MKKVIPRFYIYSGPNYIDHGRYFLTISEAEKEAKNRAYWHFIYNQARIIQIVNPSYIKFCEQIEGTPPRPNMIWRGNPTWPLQGY